MIHTKKNIVFSSAFLVFQVVFSQSWELTLVAQDVDSNGSSDYLRIGACEGCRDGFHFGEDEYDLPNAGNSYTDIQIFNQAWLGMEDENNVTCNNPNFYVDKREIKGPEFLDVWDISGNWYGSPDIVSLELSWSIDNMIDDIDIFLHIGNDEPINMKSESSTIIQSDALLTSFEFETLSDIVNIQILSGGCASTGTTTYYFDNDGDGLGSTNSGQYCEGFEPIGWVSNNLDSDDLIFCESNEIDRCNVCDGMNDCVDCNNVAWGEAFYDSCGVCSGGDTNHVPDIDIDCNGVCFGNAFIDNCEICSGGDTNYLPDSDIDCNGICFGNSTLDDCEVCGGTNETCLDSIFGNGPDEFYAFIGSEQIELSWNQLNYSSESPSYIVGFNIYNQNFDGSMNFIDTTTDEFYITSDYIEGIFCAAAYDQFNNESTYSCAEATAKITMNFTLLHEANLISFIGIPEDSAISTIFSPLVGNAQSLIGQSIATSYNQSLGWLGALTNISPTMGYWLKLSNPPIESFIVDAYPTDPNQTYQLLEGSNIISYVGIDGMPVGEAIPDEYEERFMQDGVCQSCGLIGESEATILHPSLGWLGSLDSLFHLNGYWAIVDQDMDFNWEIPNNQELNRNFINKKIKKPTPNGLEYCQSTQQAFYFVENIDINGEDLNDQDWLIAFNNNVIVGSKQWNGLYTDIPVMGADGFDDTFGYMENGGIPKFKLFKESTGEFIELFSNDVSPWKNNSLTFINLSDNNTLGMTKPTKSSINNAYPNPFNPLTTIKYTLEKNSVIDIEIHDINGKKVELLFSGIMNKGTHEITWDAKAFSSGMYFLKLNDQDLIYTYKLILLK